MTSDKVIKLYPEQLRVVEGRNFRVNYGDMKALTASVKINGIDTPLRVKKTKDKTEDGYPIYEVVKGHRRNKAMQTLYAKGELGEAAESYLIPAVEVDPKISDTDITFMILTDSEQEKLSMYEQSLGVEKLLADGVKKAEIARRMGKTATHVDDLEILIEAKGSEIYKSVEKGEMTATTAIALLKENPLPKLDKAVGKAKEEAIAKGKTKITTKHVEKAAGEALTKKSKSKSAPATTRNAADERSGPATKETKLSGGKNADALSALLGLQEALKAQADMNPKEDAFAALEGIIALLSGKKQAIELLDIFLEEAAPASKKEKKAVTKSVGKKSKVEDDEEIDDEVETKPKKKSPATKKDAKKPAAKKSASKLPQEEDEDIDEDEDLDDQEIEDEDDVDLEEDFEEGEEVDEDEDLDDDDIV